MVAIYKICNNILTKLCAGPSTNKTQKLEMSERLKSKLLLKSDENITDFLQNEDLAEELSKYLLNKYSGKFLISKGIKEVLSRIYMQGLDISSG